MNKTWLKYFLTAISITLSVMYILNVNLINSSKQLDYTVIAISFILGFFIFKKLRINVKNLMIHTGLLFTILIAQTYNFNNQTIIPTIISLISFIQIGIIKEEQNKNKYSFITFSLILYLLFQNQINEITLKLSSLDIEEVRDYIASFGIFAPLVSILLMILQSIMAPIPAFLITFSNALVFGWIKGAIISWTGAMIGASICFYIGRFLGRDVAVKYAGKSQLQTFDNYFEKYGKLSILVARLLPFVPFDPISYGAGLTNMKFSSFAIATGLGQLPATIIYSYFAGNITSGAKGILWGMCAMFIVSATIMTFKNRKEKQ